jgi:signal transduction histidine kinase
VDNLLSNAIKYTPPGGTVTVGAYADREAVTVDVTDTGIGIPADQYPQLFTRFFRASTAVDRRIKGTGLGLAVTKAIVEAHGGTIAAEPGPGGGTRFTVTLPR